MENKTKIILFFALILIVSIIPVSANWVVSIAKIIITDSNGNELILEENGGLPVNVQDQTTRPFDILINQIISTSYSLVATPSIDTYLLQLNTTAGLSVGDKIAFLEQNGLSQLHFGEIITISGNNITLDTPTPFNFTISDTTVFEYNDDLAVNGGVTRQIFSITNYFNEAVDITRFIFHCTDESSMDDATFCGQTELTNGIVLRKELTNGNYINYWNIKDNGDWGHLAFDKTYDDKAPAGVYGFASRLTYGGQSKHGVVIRLEPNESIELIVQDDLTDITHIALMVEGHFIQN